MKRRLIIAICLLGLAAQAARAGFDAPDPSRTIPDGRVLSLGRAYTGLSEGTAAIFGNPAGLASAQVWEFTTMSGKFLDEYSYLSFSGVYPTNYGNFGVGFMNASVGGAFATVKDPNSSDQDPIYIIDITAPPISYFSNVTVLSYANNLGRFIKRFGWEDRISLGLNLKFFQSGLTGGSISQGSATGNEMDLGMMYAPPWRPLALGATLKNALPTSWGGRLLYASGHEESYPAVADLGLSLNLLGKENAVRAWGANEVKLLFDYNYYPTLSGLPPTLHYGLEYKPIPMIALRFGVDQDISGNDAGGVSAVSDLTGGVGFTMGGFSFDYAYRSFAGVNGVSNNFISLTYSPPIIVPEKVIKEPIKIVSPPDKLITFDATVSMEGTVNDPRIRYMTIGDLAVKYNLKGDFIWEQELRLGKNPIVVSGFSPERRQLFSLKLRALRLMVFPDVARDFWVAQPISLLAMENIITGYPDGTFRPDGNITRAEMCSLLMKSRVTTPSTSEAGQEPAAPAEPEQKFKDVPVTHWAAEYIAEAADLGVVEGYPHKWFKPSGMITRAEGVAMIARFAGISPEAYEGGFRDLTEDHWAAPIVAGARKAGLIDYLQDKLFEAKRPLTRAEVVEILSRTNPVKAILDKDLLDWEDNY
jgi:hypothetical protein